MRPRFLLPVLLALALGTAPAAAAEPEIVGGTVAPEGAYPAQAFITSEGLVETFVCGGTLVARTKIVTAGHCVDGYDGLFPPTFTAYLGSNTRGAGTEHAVSAVIRHPSYSASATSPPTNDVAVLTLASPATQQPLALLDPAADPFPVGALARVIGWGSTAEDGDLSTSLLQVDVPLVSDEVCGSPSSYDGDLVAPVMMCAGFAEGGKDSCQGDSGGPLMFKATGMFKLLGVVSWGDGCARPNKYGVYTELPNSALRSWVLDQTGAPPTLTIDAVSGATVGTAVTLHAAAADPTPGGGVGEISWDLDADDQFDDATGASPSWTPQVAGSQLLRARVSDLDGMVSAVERSVTVAAASPPPPPPPPPPAPPPPPPAAPPPPPPAGTTPTTTQPGTTPPPSGTARRGTALLSLSARTVGGRLRVRGSVLGEGCAGGQLRITLYRGGKRLTRRLLTLGSACSFSRSFSVRGRIKVAVRFLGTTALAPVSASRTRRVR